MKQTLSSHAEIFVTLVDVSLHMLRYPDKFLRGCKSTHAVYMERRIIEIICGGEFAKCKTKHPQTCKISVQTTHHTIIDREPNHGNDRDTTRFGWKEEILERTSVGKQRWTCFRMLYVAKIIAFWTNIEESVCTLQVYIRKPRKAHALKGNVLNTWFSESHAIWLQERGDVLRKQQDNHAVPMEWNQWGPLNWKKITCRYHKRKHNTNHLLVYLTDVDTVESDPFFQWFRNITLACSV